MAKTTISWKYDSGAGDGFRIYRSDASMDPENLPSPLATVTIDKREYEDETVVQDETYYYRVSTYIGLMESVSAELEHVAEASGDEHWDKVVALLHFDGDLTDETGRIWNTGAPTSIDSANPIFGTGSLYQNGTGVGFYTSNPIGDPSSHFTIEGFCRLDALPPAFPSAPIYRRSALYSQCNNGPQGEMGLSIEHTPLPARVFLDLRGSTPPLGQYFSDREFTVPLGEVFHFAHTYDGAYHRVFINGSLYISAGLSVGWKNTSEPFRVGQSLVPNYAGYRSGSMGAFDELRITKGIARYTENFTPPTEPFPNFS